jgi:hypothetical protein
MGVRHDRTYRAPLVARVKFSPIREGTGVVALARGADFGLLGGSVARLDLCGTHPAERRKGGTRFFGTIEERTSVHALYDMILHYTHASTSTTIRPVNQHRGTNEPHLCTSNQIQA